MIKGSFSIQLNEVEWITKRKAYSSKTMTVAVIRVPKEYAGRRFIVCLPKEEEKVDESQEDEQLAELFSFLFQDDSRAPL